uniref:C3H1-type domain-containing protein n=1 Tax=Strombidinopsis acuminata TaxID=141414 RepID=A0A7S3U2U6_9SPIT
MQGRQSAWVQPATSSSSKQASWATGSSYGVGSATLGSVPSQPPALSGLEWGGVAGAAPAMPAPMIHGVAPNMPSPPSWPALGAGELPSIGSQAHALGQCKPCAFLHTKGCENGASCPFCHLCETGEKKRRRKAKVESQRAVRKAKQVLGVPAGRSA